LTGTRKPVIPKQSNKTDPTTGFHVPENPRTPELRSLSIPEAGYLEIPENPESRDLGSEHDTRNFFRPYLVARKSLSIFVLDPEPGR
jgi:hypothetical protein